MPVYQSFEIILGNNGSVVQSVPDTVPDSNYVYSVKNNYNVIDSLSFYFHGGDQKAQAFALQPDIYKYYFVGSVYGSTAISADGFSFFPSNFKLRHGTETQSITDYSLSDIKFYHTDLSTSKGFSVSCEVDFSTHNTIAGLLFLGSDGSVPTGLYAEFCILAVPIDTSDDEISSAIVTAINNQTNQLSSDIGQAADDIQQSIEDQYSGDPETEFSVDDVIAQHNEKMGVLSFGSDVMLQFLDMFQSANVGTAQLTLPGFNITVENVEYSVWPDYSFNFEQLNEWVPALMSVIRVMLPAFVWLMVLRYCINVFEKNFLSNGG